VVGGGEWSAFMPLPLTPWVSVTGIRQVGGWVGCTAGLDAVERRKTPGLCWESKTRSSSP